MTLAVMFFSLLFGIKYEFCFLFIVLSTHARVLLFFVTAVKLWIIVIMYKVSSNGSVGLPDYPNVTGKKRRTVFSPDLRT